MQPLVFDEPLTRRSSRPVERRHVDARNLHGAVDQERPAPVRSLTVDLRQGVEQARQQLLALTDGDQVEEVRHRLRVHQRRAAAENQRVAGSALAALQRNVRQIQHLQHVGVPALVAEREPQHVEVGQRSPRLPAEQRQARLAHQVRHVRKRRERAVAEVGRTVVDLLVQHPHGEVRHPDLVRVGKAQREARRGLVPGFASGVQLAARVLRGLGDAIEERRDVDDGVHMTMGNGCRHLVRHLSMRPRPPVARCFGRTPAGSHKCCPYSGARADSDLGRAQRTCRGVPCGRPVRQPRPDAYTPSPVGAIILGDMFRCGVARRRE